MHYMRMGVILGRLGGCNPHNLRWKQGKGRGRDGMRREMGRATQLFDRGLRYCICESQSKDGLFFKINFSLLDKIKITF
jgi:hypothetical protein